MFIKIFLNKDKKKQTGNFFDLSSRDRKKIIKKAVIKGAEEQRKLLKKYDRVYGKNLKLDKCRVGANH